MDSSIVLLGDRKDLGRHNTSASPQIDPVAHEIVKCCEPELPMRGLTGAQDG
jgi:hypothetical protein